MSLTGITAYLRPGTLEEALALLGEHAIAVGGGTDVIRHPHIGVTTLVDLGALPLRYIRQDRGFAVGATATLTDMLQHPGLAAHLDGVLAQMLRGVGSPLLRNAATIGGHLARGRYSDIVPVLLALDATVTLFDGTERTLPLADYYREGLHRGPALITEVGRPAGRRRHRRRLPQVHPGRLRLRPAQLRGAPPPGGRRPRRSSAASPSGRRPALGSLVAPAADYLLDGPLDDERIATAAAIAAHEIAAQDDQRASAEYRRHLCRVGVRRCLDEARRRLAERRP